MRTYCITVTIFASLYFITRYTVILCKLLNNKWLTEWFKLLIIDETKLMRLIHTKTIFLNLLYNESDRNILCFCLCGRRTTPAQRWLKARGRCRRRYNSTIPAIHQLRSGCTHPYIVRVCLSLSTHRPSQSSIQATFEAGVPFFQHPER